MDDVTTVDTLRRLEPAIDEEMALRMWRRRRAQRAKQRRIVGGAVGAAVVVAAVGAGLLVAGGDSGDVVVAGEGEFTSSGQDVDFMVLAQEEYSGPGGVVRAAMNTEELEALWDGLRLQGSPPSLDFEDWVVIGMTINDDTCTPNFEGFSVASDVFTPVFVEVGSACFSPNIPKAFVVALHRDEMPARFVVRIPPGRTDANDEEVLVEVVLTG